MSKIEDLTNRILAFRDARNWKQFHNPKDCALSLVLEATEVMEHFQWKNAQEMEVHIQKNRMEIGEELADTLYWILLMANDLDIDVLNALEKKIEKNEAKYPVEKSKDKHTKYDKLD
jgi:NTP pyrophosphatase (non-canonical NTP hydrolase)